MNDQERESLWPGTNPVDDNGRSVLMSACGTKSAPINDADLDAVEASWFTEKTITIPNVVLDESPLTELLVKAHNIFAAGSYENLDALACRIADVCPEGVTEENFAASKPVAGACKKFFSNVDELRKGLKRPALDWGKAVEKAAKATAEMARPTLDPIINGVKAIKDRRKAEKQAKAEAEQKAIEDAARQKIEDERKAEDERRAAELADQKRLNDELNARLAKEREIQAEKDSIANAESAKQKSELDRMNAELAEFRAAKAAAAKIETDRLTAQAAREAAEEKAVAEAKRLEAMRPDIDVIHGFGHDIAELAEDAPMKLKSESARELVQWAVDHLQRIAKTLTEFGTTTTEK